MVRKRSAGRKVSQNFLGTYSLKLETSRGVGINKSKIIAILFSIIDIPRNVKFSGTIVCDGKLYL